MGFLKDIKEIKQTLNRVSNSIDNKVLTKARKYDELKSYLKNITFDVKISEVINNLGETSLELTYTLPKVILNFDENGELLENKIFTSINMLDLIDIKDIITLHEKITTQKKKR